MAFYSIRTHSVKNNGRLIQFLSFVFGILGTVTMLLLPFRYALLPLLYRTGYESSFDNSFILNFILLSIGSVIIFIAKKINQRAALVMQQSKRIALDKKENNFFEFNQNGVLYLRSFEKDSDAIISLNEIKIDNMIVTSDKVATFEELILKPFQSIGPTIAIGNPAEEETKMGAFRTYHSNETWQSYINDAITKSKLILIRAGNTEGVRWEINQVLNLASHNKILILTPDISKTDDLEIFLQYLSERTRSQIIRKDIDQPKSWFSKFTLFSSTMTHYKAILFDKNWNIYVYNITSDKNFKESLRTNNRFKMPIALRFFLNDFSEHFGIKKESLPISGGRLIWVTAIVMGYIALLAFPLYFILISG
jgi:hypothetical protein